jgi:hypothetical protein
MDEFAYRAWLKLQPIGPKTVIDQISRARRLERAFGDLDVLFAQDHMSNLIGISLGKGTLLPKELTSIGMASDTKNTLRQAARTYRKFRDEDPPLPLSIPSKIEPRQTPKSPLKKRTLQPTGFWMFSASPGKWNSEEWSNSGAFELLYYVSEDDRSLIQPGDLGFLKRNVWRYVSAEILALFEVVEAVRMRDEPDPKYFLDEAAGRKPDWRVKLNVLAHLDPPISVDSLPDNTAFKYVRHGLQRTTTAVSGEVFQTIVERAGLSDVDIMAARGALSRSGVAQLESNAANLDPKAKHRMSKYIERGPIGAAVKNARQHRCQICEALGGQSLGFLKTSGERYSEAHHVMPVSKLATGSLGAHNIMVLCPNHHRQVHYGNFKQLKSDLDGWHVKLDDKKLHIPRTKIS